MASTINASSTNGIVQTADGSGIIKVQSSGVTTNALAWVNFAGTTGAIRASYNVSSVTRASAGLYTVNFTTALTDANYAVAGTCGSGGSVGGIVFGNYQLAPTTTACTILTLSFAGSTTDYTYTSLAIHGN